MKFAFGICIAALGITASAQAQTVQERRAERQQQREATSDAGRPGAPLVPPGKVQPLSGDGVTPLSDNYLGDAPDPTKRGFLTAPGYAPVPRQDEHRPRTAPQGTPLPNSGVVVTLPPANAGRQGLPAQTWGMLTPRQQDLHRQAETAAIGSPLGEGFVWSDQGRRGEVRVVADRMFNNRPCRDFAHFVIIDGQRIDGTTTVCR